MFVEGGDIFSAPLACYRWTIVDKDPLLPDVEACNWLLGVDVNRNGSLNDGWISWVSDSISRLWADGIELAFAFIIWVGLNAAPNITRNIFDDWIRFNPEGGFSIAFTQRSHCSSVSAKGRTSLGAAGASPSMTPQVLVFP